jgi:plasmid stabilization system protein ParE
MTLRVRFTPQAEAKAARAIRWWERNRPSSPTLLADELDGCLALLTTAPDLGRPYRHRRVAGLRRVLLVETRHHVYYVHDDQADQVVVLAIWSAVRGRVPPIGMGR